LLIAGSTFDEEEGEEIEAIVKISLVAKRIKNLANKQKIDLKNDKNKREIFAEERNKNRFKPNILTKTSARGLN
jgi:hypothetical protein